MNRYNVEPFFLNELCKKRQKIATAMLNMTTSNFHFAFYLGKLHMRITADQNSIGATNCNSLLLSVKLSLLIFFARDLVYSL